MLNSLLLASALALAAENSQMRSIEALVHIDKSGRVQKLDWLHPDQVSDALSAYLKPEVLAVEFEPAQKNGQVTYTELLLNVVIEATPRNDGQSNVRFVTVEKAGPRMVKVPMARYPEQMLMSATSAYMMLSVEVSADGRVVEDSIALNGETPPKDAAKMRQFFRSAKVAVRRAQFNYLENVGGVKIGGRINMPFVFCVDNCDAINAKVAKLRTEQVFVPSVNTDVKFANIKANATPKAAAGS